MNLESEFLVLKEKEVAERKRFNSSNVRESHYAET